MDKEMSLDKFKAEFPAIAEALIAEGKEAGNTDGAAAERKRIQDVEAQAMPGHETLIASLKFDGKTTGPEAAVQVLAAEKKKAGAMLTDIIHDAPKAAAPAAEQQPDKPKADDHVPLEDRCKAEWNKDEKIRAEFLTLESYIAFKKAEGDGRVKILGNK